MLARPQGLSARAEGGVDKCDPCVRRDEGELYIKTLAHQFNAGHSVEVTIEEDEPLPPDPVPFPPYPSPSASLGRSQRRTA